MWPESTGWHDVPDDPQDYDPVGKPLSASVLDAPGPGPSPDDLHDQVLYEAGLSKDPPARRRTGPDVSGLRQAMGI
jgi:hypothetical protein